MTTARSILLGAYKDALLQPFNYRPGVYTALVTPFTANDTIDTAALIVLIERQIAQQASGIVVCGTTGEGTSLNEQEWQLVVQTAVHTAAGRIIVVAATGTAATRSTLHYQHLACQLGVDAALVITPYYVKPSQDGLIHHYRTLSEQVPSLPIWIYHIPGRTGVTILPETMQRLWQLPAVQAVKDCRPVAMPVANDHWLQWLSSNHQQWLLIGDDPLTYLGCWAGAAGVVSVTANLLPQSINKLVAASCQHDQVNSQQLHQQLLPLHEALFGAPNPVPVKAALAMLGLCRPDVRLPMVALTAAEHQKLQFTLSRFDFCL